MGLLFSDPLIRQIHAVHEWIAKSQKVVDVLVTPNSQSDGEKDTCSPKGFRQHPPLYVHENDQGKEDRQKCQKGRLGQQAQAGQNRQQEAFLPSGFLDKSSRLPHNQSAEKDRQRIVRHVHSAHHKLRKKANHDKTIELPETSSYDSGFVNQNIKNDE